MTTTYNVRYKQYLITDNTIIRRTGFGAISFENIGTEKPMMMTMIAMTTSNSTNVNPDTLRIL